LSDRYIDGIPEGSRATHSEDFGRDDITEEKLSMVRALNEIAEQRGQSLAQMALAWTLHDPRVTSALPGASSLEQLEQNVAALDTVDFTADELDAINRASGRHASAAGR
jgi:L-glyceraldehyde 3-phosphate reductase